MCLHFFTITERALSSCVVVRLSGIYDRFAFMSVFGCVHLSAKCYHWSFPTTLFLCQERHARFNANCLGGEVSVSGVAPSRQVYLALFLVWGWLYSNQKCMHVTSASLTAWRAFSTSRKSAENIRNVRNPSNLICRSILISGFCFADCHHCPRRPRYCFAEL